MPHSYLVAARRSAVVPHGGALSALELHQLAAPVVGAILADAGLRKEQVGELIVSNALGAGGNSARLVALESGLPERVAGLSIDRQCCGGLDALLLADAMIRSGQHDIVIAGGVESHSRRPLRYRTFADRAEPQAYDQAPFTPWPDRDPDMAEAADRLAGELGISRREQDDWAMASHAKAIAAWSNLEQEIVPVANITADSFTRTLSPRLCARAPEVAGRITMANMAVAADAAAFCILVSERLAHHMQGPTLALLGGKTLGADPTLPGLAPIPAIEASLEQAGLMPDELAVAEIMEAFAVQAIACQIGAHIPLEAVNQEGGALARGHPIGASGAILAVRLFHQLKGSGAPGLAAIASAGGLGTALVVKDSA